MTPRHGLPYLATVAALVVAVVPFGEQREANTQASYDGRTIDVSEDWDGAQACAVFSAERVECFDTFEEMEAATGGGEGGPEDHDVAGSVVVASGATLAVVPDLAREVERAAALPRTSIELAADCNNDNSKWLYLFEHVNFAGRTLKFNDVNYWQNLTSYDFNDQASSYWNNTACNAYFAEHTNGGGTWLLIVSNTSASSMPSGWNDRVSSLYIIG